MENIRQKKKSEDYRNMGDDALSDHIKESVLRLKSLKFSHSVNPIENPMSIRAARRLIARLKTEQHKRNLSSN